VKVPERDWTIADAVRAAVPLWLCNFGPSGCGKTYTALEEATGIQQVLGGDIYGIDTEGNRMLAYADYFKFKHVPFSAPYGSLHYFSAITAIYKRGGRIIIIDSASHEHESDGGLLDFQEKEVDRMAGDDWKKREQVKMLAWSKPKAARRALLNGMTALKDVAFILNFRAADISKPVKAEGKKTEVVHMGFTPIGAREFVYEATVSMFLPPASKGTPLWNSENESERMMAKLPKQFEGLFQQGQQITREHGRKVAEWARGNAPDAPPTVPLADRIAKVRTAIAKANTEAKLRNVWELAADLRSELTNSEPMAANALHVEYKERLKELTKGE
jgi:hypothetical protein